MPYFYPMKKMALLVLMLGVSCSVSAAAHYVKGDTLNVLALSGLRLRDQPGGKTVLATIPYASMLVVQEDQPADRNETVDQLPGHWVQVLWQGKTGYVFDGYLSMLPAPGAQITDLVAYCNAYFVKKGKPVEVKFGEEEETNDIGIQYYTWKNLLVEIKTNGYYESSSQTMTIDPAYRVSPEEMFLLSKAIYRKDVSESLEKIETGEFKADEEIMQTGRPLDKNYYNFIPLQNCRDMKYYFFSEACYEGLSIGQFGYMIFIQRWGGC